jgi:hypothetical protein
MSEHLLRRVLAGVVAVVLAGASTADARPRPSHARHFEANKTFGLGIMVGAPTGLTGKYWVGPDQAIDFGIGAIGYYRGRSGLHIHGDYLWHPVSLAHADAFELPFYLGVGARFFDFGCNGCARNAVAIGVRVPFGISFDFNRVPLDVFIELAVVADFFVNYSDNLGADLDGAVGFRYYFN